MIVTSRIYWICSKYRRSSRNLGTNWQEEILIGNTGSRHVPVWIVAVCCVNLPMVLQVLLSAALEREQQVSGFGSAQSSFSVHHFYSQSNWSWWIHSVICCNYVIVMLTENPSRLILVATGGIVLISSAIRGGRSTATSLATPGQVS